MTTFTLSTLDHVSTTRDSLLQELNYLNREGLKVKITEDATGKFRFLNCTLVEADQGLRSTHEKILRYYLSNIITDLLMNDITKEVILKILKHKYQFLAKEEQKSVLQQAYSALNNVSEDEKYEKTLGRHQQILTQVQDYLNTSSSLFLEGFLRFRLKNYFHEVEESVENAVDNYLVEQEYHEFVKLLRYFVEIQEPRIDQVNVLFKDKETFYLMDENYRPIDQSQLEKVLLEISRDVEYDDLLLSALITISPREIVLHVINEVEVIETIVNVFRERVTICRGCEICTMHGWIPVELLDPLHQD